MVTNDLPRPARTLSDISGVDNIAYWPLICYDIFLRTQIQQGGLVVVSQAVLATLEELVACFDELEEPRSEINRTHPLASVVAISLMAVLAGADGPTSIRQSAKSLEENLPYVLDLPNDIPSRDVIRRVLCALKPEAFQECFTDCIS